VFILTILCLLFTAYARHVLRAFRSSKVERAGLENYDNCHISCLYSGMPLFIFSKHLRELTINFDEDFVRSLLSTGSNERSAMELQADTAPG